MDKGTLFPRMFSGKVVLFLDGQLDGHLGSMEILEDEDKNDIITASTKSYHKNSATSG